MGRRLLYITNGIAGAGGLERVLSVRTRLLAERYGDEIHILTLNEEGKEPFYDFWPGIHVHDVRMQGNPAARLKAWASGVRKAVRAVKPAVVSVCDDGFKGFWIPFLLTGCGCPVVYERHVSRLIQADGLKSSALMKLEFALMRFLGKRFSRFVVLTPGNREEWPMAERDGGKLREEIRREGLEESFLLHPPTRRIMREYLRSSICAMSSRYEGFGMMLAEAMACGVPCVAFDCPCGPGDIIRHGEDGLLARPGKVAELASALELLMGNEKLRASMAAKARENVKRYAAETVAAQWDGLFRRILQERKGGKP